MRTIMFTVVVLLMLSGVVGSTADTCPEAFTCQWEGHVFVLQCRRVDENLQSKMVVGTIADLPANVTHLKIDCYRLHRFVLLTFVGLHRVRSLTVANIKLSTLGLFHGVDNISRLVLRNVSLKHMGNDSFQGLRQLLSLILDHLDELEYMHADVLKP